MSFNNDQEKFWAETYAKDYIKKNSQFDNELGARAWTEMLQAANGRVDTYLECGCNIGRNVAQLKLALPDAKASIIEVSPAAFNYVTSKHEFDRAFNGAILDSEFDSSSFDLVFTMGVLIHIAPDHLLAHMERMVRYASRYILIGEYFNRTPVTIEYQGEVDRLFKRDFGRLFAENFQVNLLDYGFLWGYIYDSAGFDDITWWLFEKS